jgi:site-specific recombinase XerD
MGTTGYQPGDEHQTDQQAEVAEYQEEVAVISRTKEWLQDASGYLSKRTQRVYTSHLLGLLNSLGGKVSLSQVTRHQVLHYITGLKPSMARQALSAIKWAALELQKDDRTQSYYRTYQQIQSVKGPKLQGHKVGHWLTLEEARALVQSPGQLSPNGLRDTAMLAVMVGCGLRREEITKLTWNMIGNTSGRHMLSVIGKGNKNRTIPIPDWIMDKLNGWRTYTTMTNQTQYMYVFPPIDEDGYLTPYGQGMSGTMIWNIVRKYGEVIGKPTLAPHDLRRTCAHLLREAGGEIEQIQMMLGHSSIKTTEIYLGSKQEFVKGKAVTDLVKW